jgi:branched-chain amino acid transport system ATP-binding protein
MSAATPAEPVTFETSTDTVLELRDVHAGYADLDVLRGVSLKVATKSIVTLLGPNGAGKTTVMRVISGLLRASAGEVLVNGSRVGSHSPEQRSHAGVCLIPEGRGIFRSLTVRENLSLFRPSWAPDTGTDRIVEMFPVLGDRINQVAGTMSGGEQQMLALSRAFLSQPSVVLVDEASMGLAPKMVDQIFDVLGRLASDGVSVLIVEQYARRALELADYAYVLSRGEVVLSGPTREIAYADVAATYLS